MDENKRESCNACGIAVVQYFKVNNKEVCKKCKKDFKDNGKFTRDKVSVDYTGAYNLIAQWRKENAPKRRVSNKR